MNIAPLLGVAFQGFVRPARQVHTVFIHCTAASNPKVGAREVDRWHKEKGWAGVGYQYVIRTDGVVEHGRTPELAPAAQEGHNTGTLAICVNGLLPADFNALQMAALVDLCHKIDSEYPKGLRFRGHCEVSSKACPVFDYKKALRLSVAGKLPGQDPGHGAPVAEPGLPLLEDSTATVPVTRKTVRLGAFGPEVTRLQTLLVTYSPEHPGEVDGFFGPRVAKSVMAFQRSHWLVPDGVVGPVTWEALETM
jgi:hypothetical protein